MLWLLSYSGDCNVEYSIAIAGNIQLVSKAQASEVAIRIENIASDWRIAKYRLLILVF